MQIPLPASRRAPRVGLVLGAGGVTGIAWLAGALRAIREHTGWDPAQAALLSGTSAGSVAATVLAAGQDPCDLLVYAEEPHRLAEAVSAATVGRGPEGLALPWPGSLGRVAGGLVGGTPRQRLASVTGLLPRGLRSGDEIRGLAHEAASVGWPTDGRLWLHACDMRSGRLVTFGREGAPDAPLADAVVASCAVPSYYRPVTIGGRRYIDGGLRSLTNADRLAGQPLDAVLILSPFSTNERGHFLDTAIFGMARAATAGRAAREAQLLRDAGMQVACVGPAAADIRVAGLNPMDRSRSRLVMETATESVAARLDEALGDLSLTAPRRGARRLRLVA